MYQHRCPCQVNASLCTYIHTYLHIYTHTCKIQILMNACLLFMYFHKQALRKLCEVAKVCRVIRRECSTIFIRPM